LPCRRRARRRILPGIMRLLLRLVFVVVFAVLACVCFHQARIAQNADPPDSGKVVMLFVAVVTLAVVGGGIFAFTVLPAIAETAGNVFYSPGEEIEKSPHDEARAKVAQGDFDGAIEEFRKVVEKDPTDTFALAEISRIYCEKLHQPDQGAAVFEEALQNEWPPDAAAFIANRLADVYWKNLNEPLRAREVLVQIAETMPDTRHAQNALHKLQEIDKTLQE
jgi:hypothetical protein